MIGMVRQGDSVVELKRVYPSLFSNLMEDMSTSEHLSGDIEDIAIISQKLNGALVSISESRAGTTAPMEKKTQMMPMQQESKLMVLPIPNEMSHILLALNCGQSTRSFLMMPLRLCLDGAPS